MPHGLLPFSCLFFSLANRTCLTPDRFACVASCCSVCRHFPSSIARLPLSVHSAVVVLRVCVCVCVCVRVCMRVCVCARVIVFSLVSFFVLFLFCGLRHMSCVASSAVLVCCGSNPHASSSDLCTISAATPFHSLISLVLLADLGLLCAARRVSRGA